MTDQERPVEERNELLDDLVQAATAVAEPDESKQQPAVNTQPESAAQAATPTADEAQPGETSAATEQSVEVAANEAQPVDEAEQSVDVPAAADEAEQSVDVQAEADEADQSADAPAAAAEVALDSGVAEPQATPPVVEQSAEANPAPAEVVLAALVDPYGAAEASPAGASYVPIAEDDGGKPRRVKDLEPGMELEGRVTSIALYGIFVDIGVGRDGLVHISEMSDTRIDSPSDLVQIGDTVHVRVKSVEPDGRRISLTMRSKERAGQPRERGRKKTELDREKLASLRVGDNIEGTVTGIAPFGVFVDIGVGKDGLVHVSELSEGRIDKAEDAVQVGQSYTFKVLEVDADGTRISLSLRRAQRGQRMAQLEKGQILEGTVSGMAPFGAFVDIGVGRDGLVHISELADHRVGKVEDVVKVGDKVTVRVLEIDSGSKRISLSMRLDDRPREAPEGHADVSPEPREDRGRRDDRGPRGPRRERTDEPKMPETYTSTEGPEEEAFSGDATIEDLLSKFGGKRDRKRRYEEEEEEETLPEDRHTRRQREAIRRTLQQMSDEE
jgi:predicted RNA-binding protein with RPS1 domain